MAHSETKQEPLGVGLAQRELGRRHGEGITRPDVGDARCDHHSLGGRQQDAGVGQRITIDRLTNPKRPVAQLFELSRYFPHS